MNEFVTAVYEILDAETGSGEDLEGLKILKNEHESLTTANCGIMRGREVTIEQAHQYKVVEGFVNLYVSKYVDKKSSDELSWYDAEVSTENWGRIVERILMNNAALVSTTYPDGISFEPENTHITEKSYNHQLIQDARYVVLKMTLRAIYKYLNGVLSVE